MSGSRIMSGIRPVGAIGSGGEVAGGEVAGGESAGDAVADGGLEVDAEEELDMGMRRTAKMNDPKEPKKQEREEHEKTHLPFQELVQALHEGPGQGGGTQEARRRWRVA